MTETRDTLGIYPTSGWVKDAIRGRNIRLPRGAGVQVPFVNACIIGSVARGQATTESDLDIGVIILPKRQSSLEITERHHTQFSERDLIRMNIQGITRVIDFQFFSPKDSEFQEFLRWPKIWLRQTHLPDWLVPKETPFHTLLEKTM